MHCVETVVLAEGQPAVVLETGRVARQADGALWLRHGDTVILATVVVGRPVTGGDFVPLTVEYREKLAAIGRIPGNYQRRELRLGDHETLVSRLIDRAVRPLFAPGFAAEVQLDVTVYGADEASDLTGLALVAAGGALALAAAAPTTAPVAGLRLVGRGRRWLPYAAEADAENAELDLVVAATPDGVLMFEGEAEAVTEARVLEAFTEAERRLAPLLAAMVRLRAAAGVPDYALGAGTSTAEPALDLDPAAAALIDAHWSLGSARLRRQHLPALRQAWMTQGVELDLDAAIGRRVRTGAAAGRRLDGRGLADIRPIECLADVLPSNHGSALFTRGETQVLVSATLGGPRDGQDTESLAGHQHARFLLHYNFPSFAVGEAKASRGPGRRELGHGHLARRALASVMPGKARYPFTVRVVSDVTESNGSSSMATVCGATLALAAAGVPLKAPVAGVAMGAVRVGATWHVLTDIAGDEDHHGDVDLKVAGTAEGITALQLDSKVGALPAAVLAEALAAAAQARRRILATMAPCLAALADPAQGPRRNARIEINAGRVGALIGTGGRNLQALQQKTGTRIEVLGDGQVFILGRHPAGVEAAVAAIQGVSLELRRGGLYQGQVVSLRDIGAFVRVGEHEALVHTSELGPPGADGSAPVAVGESVVVRVLGADDRGRLRLSRRAALGAAEPVLNA